MTTPANQTEKFSVLFVCTGNICRSPMAEGVLKDHIPEERKGDFDIRSAGTGAWHGAGASEHAISVCSIDNIDISDHRSQPVTRQLMIESKLIFACAQNHYDLMIEAFPNYQNKIFLLKRFDRDGSESDDDSIADPIGESHRYYESIYDEIQTEIKRVLRRVLAMADETATESRRS